MNWRWPLESGWRLAGTVIVVCVLAAALGSGSHRHHKMPNANYASSATSTMPASSTTAVSASTTTTSASGTPPAVNLPAPGPATQACVAFLRLWATPRAQPVWSKRLRPYATGQEYAELAVTMPADIPARRIGPVVSSSADSGQVEVATDGGKMVCSMVPAGSRFLVGGVEPVG